ncbi:MAG: efflux RND transporter permease subunit [Prosthecobacter sp.]|jgi:CzcA family heavy metal efflux pump|uniref:efflux RND transporter permease subunit n=1 Tax=Prosthecobacter sp. TaxID=1965333 RepID=UPI0019E14376|nr:efflux RND transporter permease subunit [Prosthecobacter sp.]MBE2284651.1 efflux RND transporter permease subunit [Prosthecobacter sp.]
MLNSLIRFSLHHRPLVLMTALATLLFGYQTLTQLPVEVLPDMTKPTVTLLTEAPGLAPEEVETLVTQPIEAAVQGVGGLDRLRSNSDVGLSLVFAEFAWGTDIYRARQLVQERLQAALNTLPKGAKPGMTPVSSLMGEILLVGLRSEDGKVPPMDLRTLADWTIRRRLQSISGVAEVLTIGGGVKQIQVQPDPNRLAAFGVTFDEIEAAVGRAAGNATSGYLQAGPREIMVRNLGMTTRLEDIAKTVIKTVGDRPVLISDVAQLAHGVQTMRGDASVNGTMGVVLSIDKAPGFDTLKLTRQIEEALAELRPTLPPGVSAEILFRQGDFIEHAIGNLEEAIRDGAIMVAIILFLFLLNLRTTFITLMAMPLSFAVTILTFKAFGVSVNSMTLGGLAVAIGMVVDDAIVDVENVWRRLRESPSKIRLDIIASASGEVRNSILYATVLVILVFLPLFGLEGIEGHLFTPIAIATITSMAASFVVSLTVIPVLCSLLLSWSPGFSRFDDAPDRLKAPLQHRDSFVVRGMKWFVERTFLKLALGAPLLVIALAGVLLVGSLLLYPIMGKEFLPAFNEGSATISLASAPGTSLAQSNEIGEVGVQLLQNIDGVKSVGRRAGRAERDDHVMPVSVNEFDVEFHEGGRPREAVFAEIREKLGKIPGTFLNIGQPIGHRLSHMLSGVSAKIAVKIFGPDLTVLRDRGAQVRDIAKTIPGLTDVILEAQVSIPQIKIEVDRERAVAYGVQPGALNEQVSALLGGKTVTELREGQRTVDLVLRLPEALRDSPEKLGDLLIETDSGQRIPLRLVADIREGRGPNVINRENTQRRMVISANSSMRDLEGIVRRWQAAVNEKLRLPEGYFIRFEGEFQAQEAAARRIAFYFTLVLLAVTILLHGYFRSLSLALQVMLNIPLALMGGLFLTWLLIDNISIATIVGFIAVGGVAARNGIMMISHYLHLMRHEGEGFTRQMIVRGTLERLVPVLMTALSAGIALIPLLLAANEPGKEILHPVAVVIVGGLVSSTLLDLMITPAVFYLFGRKAALKHVQTHTL